MYVAKKSEKGKEEIVAMPPRGFPRCSHTLARLGGHFHDCKKMSSYFCSFSLATLARILPAGSGGNTACHLPVLGIALSCGASEGFIHEREASISVTMLSARRSRMTPLREWGTD